MTIAAHDPIDRKIAERAAAELAALRERVAGLERENSKLADCPAGTGWQRAQEIEAANAKLREALGKVLLIAQKNVAVWVEEIDIADAAALLTEQEE